MKRRKALKQIGLGAAAGLVLPAWLSSCKHSDPGPEIKYAGTVAIIGAGAAGLYAADILIAKGISVIVFEAGDRIGGRIKSLRLNNLSSDSLTYNSNTPPNADFPVELGADRIIGSDSEWGNMINLQKIPVNDLSANNTGYIVDSTFKTDVDLAGDSDFENVKIFLSKLDTFSSEAGSVQQTVQVQGASTRMRPVLNSLVGNKYGTSNDLLGMKAIAESALLRKRNDTELTLSTNPMQDVLLSRFSAVIPKIKFSTAVKSIEYSSDTITITDQNNGATTVNTVIVTVPVSVLKNGEIGFSPALPSDKINSLNRMGMDASVRVVLEFKKNFWGDGIAFIYGGVQAPEYFSAGINRSRFNNMLSITINGPKAKQLSALGFGMISSILAELDTLFNGQASINIRRDDSDNVIAIIQDWSKEKYIYGYGSYIKPGGSNADRITLSTSVNKKLFFAGEATDVAGESATINGALLSGERAALEVIDVITAA